MVVVENHDIPSDTNPEKRTELLSKVSAQLGLRDYLGGDSWGQVDHGCGEFGQRCKKETNAVALVTGVLWARLAGPNRHHANKLHAHELQEETCQRALLVELVHLRSCA